MPEQPRCVDCRTVVDLAKAPKAARRRIRCADCLDVFQSGPFAGASGCFRDRAFRQKYGVSIEQVRSLAQATRGRCSACRERPATDVDHCHDTGKVRGVVCTPCNTSLGAFGDDVVSIKRAIDYLLMPPFESVPEKLRVVPRFLPTLATESPGYEALWAAYHEEKLGLGQIAQRYNTTRPTVTTWMRRSGIALRSKAEGTRIARAARPKPTLPPVLDQVLSSVSHTEGGCWLWTGSCNAGGVPRMWRDGRFISPRRAAYDATGDGAATGRNLFPNCLNQLCVAPAHAVGNRGGRGIR